MVDEVPVAEFVGLGREEKLEEWHCFVYILYFYKYRGVSTYFQGVIFGLWI